LIDHAAEPADPKRDVPNPERRKLDGEIRHARAELQRLAAKYGAEALLNEEALRPTMRGFKIAQAGLSAELKGALVRVGRLRARRAKLPPRVPVASVTKRAVVKLSTERKHLTSVIKMVAYQMESDLVDRIGPWYRRAEQEGRTLVHSMFASVGDLEVNQTELRLTVAALSSAHKTRILEQLCRQLDQIGALFPGRVSDTAKSQD